MLRKPILACVLAPLALASCGGGASQPPATPSPAPPTTTGAPDAPSGGTSSTPASSAGATAGSAPAGEPAYDDPNESAGTIAMSVELAKGTPKSAFPKKTSDEQSCWQGVSLGGSAQKDYDAIAAACGQPTGLLQYAKPVTGKLHATKDKTDVFSLDLQKGLCYRYFAAADRTITDIDILVEKPGGALVADDKQTGPVAIIESDKTWCMDEDAKYEFHVQIDGAGTGGYVFGVWARPKK